MPYPKGNTVRINTFVDADNVHDIETKRSINGVLMFINKNPIHWHIRRKNTVETSTNRSDLMDKKTGT